MEELITILINLFDTCLLITYLWTLYPLYFSDRWRKDFLFLILLFSVSISVNTQKFSANECVKYLYLGIIAGTCFKGDRIKIIWDYLKIASIFFCASWLYIIWPAKISVVQNSPAIQRIGIGICAGLHLITAAFLMFRTRRRHWRK